MEEIVAENGNKGEIEDESEWLDIIGNGGLKKKVLVAGLNDIRPNRGDEVTIAATGYLEDGTEVEELDELTFSLGGGEVIAGFDLAVALMYVNEEAEVFMESRFAYGKLGVESSILPNANLVYKIKLVNVTSENSPDELKLDERKEIGERKRQRGNFWFNREEYSQSIQCYKDAVDFLDFPSDPSIETDDDEVRDIIEMNLKTLNNMAAAQIKIEAYEAALISLSPVLKCQPNNVKALYRKGKILTIHKKYKEALEIFDVALSLEPASKLIPNEVQRVQLLLKRETDHEKSLYRKMLGLESYSDPSKNEDRHPALRVKHLKTVAIAFILLFAIGMSIRAFV